MIPEIEYKQYVIVPKKPRMSVGKIASQVAHATYMALEHEDKTILKKWKENGMCVIVLECNDALHLNWIKDYLAYWKVRHHMYIDEGLTEIDMGTPTALATGIIPSDKQWMFSTLKLFKRRW